MLAAMLILHGSMMLGKSVGIDADQMFYKGRDFYISWLVIGRQGLVLLKFILMGGNYNPYLCGALTIIFMVIAGIAWTYLFKTASGKTHKTGNILFCLILAGHTILTEQFYFKIQSAEVSLGFVMTAISIHLAYRLFLEDGALSKNWQKILSVFLIVLLNLITFSIYQVMIPLYIFGCVAVLFLHYGVKNREGKRAWTVSFEFAGIFIFSFILNEIITILFFSKSSYTSDQIYWKQESVSKCIYQIISHIARAGVIGKGIYYAPTYAVFVLLMIILTVYLMKTQKSNRIYLAVVALFIVTAPFYMTILIGGEVVIRSQLVMPFTMAYMGYLISLPVGKLQQEYTSKSANESAQIADKAAESANINSNIPNEKKKIKFIKILRILALSVSVITITEQSVLTLMLNHTDAVRYKQDEALAYELIEKIDEVQNADRSLPVVFIGSHPSEPGSFCIKSGEIIGYSFFDWDTDLEPYSYYSTMRIIAFMSMLGTRYEAPDTSMVKEAYEYSKSMDDYPDADSIQIYDGMIIVRLSE